MMSDQVLRRNRLFGCHSQKLRKEREEKKKEREKHSRRDAQERRKRKRAMHGNA